MSEIGKGKNAEVDYAKLIKGYDNMVCSHPFIMPDTSIFGLLDYAMPS